MSFNENIIEAVWNKARKIPNNDKWRKDACGAWIYKDSYGLTSDGGWEIDHIYPKSMGGSDSLNNLQPLHWENNRGKGDNYPKYSCAITSKGTENVPA